MRVLIVHETLYGTNRKIAVAIAGGFGGDVGVAIVAARTASSAIGAARRPGMTWSRFSSGPIGDFL